MRSRNRIPLILGGGMLLFFLIAAAFPHVFAPYGRKEMFESWLEPCAEHLLGTNALGYDVFTELVYGAGDTLTIGLFASILTLAVGTLMGTAAARTRAAGLLANGFINLFLLLPRLITLIVLSAFLGSSRIALILLIAAFSWVGTARAVRARVMWLQSRPFMEACTVQGLSRWHTAWYHIFPNLKDILLARFLLGINSCMMMESTLSFLGFGDLYHPTWGTMMNFAYKRGAFMRHAYGYLLSPGICILLLSLSFYLLSLSRPQENQTS